MALGHDAMVVTVAVIDPASRRCCRRNAAWRLSTALDGDGSGEISKKKSTKDAVLDKFRGLLEPKCYRSVVVVAVFSCLLLRPYLTRVVFLDLECNFFGDVLLVIALRVSVAIARLV